jgi:NADH-quinone oxidoreductase subunit M
MILLWLLVVPVVAGILSAVAALWNKSLPRWIALIAACLDLTLTLTIRRGSARWIEQLDWIWIPEFGIHFHLAMDGLSLLLVILTFFLGIMAVLAAWREIRENTGFFYLNLLFILAGIAGVFLATDLFLFYFAWELMLVPMYFLIAMWGHENRTYASIKFFIFTQLSGLLMLIAILALYFAHHAATGVYSFQYDDLLGTAMAPSTAIWIMLGFFVAFAVKLPMVPFHPWLADAHTEAPTAGSVILAGLLLKTGAYGMLRFVVPLFPEAARALAPVAMTLAVIGILYGAILAFGQTDLKRLVAYTSVSHMGFVLLGIFAWNPLALQGVLLTMICHGVSTGALFIIVGALQDRTHTREMPRLGGLWATIPYMSGAALFFGLASLGLPGLGDFIGEFLVILGAFRGHVVLTIFATAGILAATFYALRIIQRAFQGPNENRWTLPDLSPREGFVMAVMMVALLWLGLYPQPVIDRFNPALRQLTSYAQPTSYAQR